MIKKFNEFIIEGVRDKMIPKSEEDIEDAFEEVANKVADILVDNYDYEDFLEAYEWAYDHKDEIMQEIENDSEYDLDTIIKGILYGYDDY